MIISPNIVDTYTLVAEYSNLKILKSCGFGDFSAVISPGLATLYRPTDQTEIWHRRAYYEFTLAYLGVGCRPSWPTCRLCCLRFL